jgi:hypothetical protein
VAFLLSVDQAGFQQDRHVMRDGGLGKVDTLLDVAGTKPAFFAEGACIPDLQRLQDFTASGICDCVQETLEALVLGGHGLGIERKLMDVNVGERAHFRS